MSAGPIKTAIWEGSSSPESVRDWGAYNGTAYGPVFAKTARYKERWLQSPRNFKAPEDVALCCWKVCCWERLGTNASQQMRARVSSTTATRGSWMSCVYAPAMLGCRLASKGSGALVLGTRAMQGQRCPAAGRELPRHA